MWLTTSLLVIYFLNILEPKLFPKERGKKIEIRKLDRFSIQKKAGRLEPKNMPNRGKIRISNRRPSVLQVSIKIFDTIKLKITKN